MRYDFELHFPNTLALDDFEELGPLDLAVIMAAIMEAHTMFLARRSRLEQIITREYHLDQDDQHRLVIHHIPKENADKDWDQYLVCEITAR